MSIVAMSLCFNGRMSSWISTSTSRLDFLVYKSFSYLWNNPLHETHTHTHTNSLNSIMKPCLTPKKPPSAPSVTPSTSSPANSVSSISLPYALSKPAPPIPPCSIYSKSSTRESYKTIEISPPCRTNPRCFPLLNWMRKSA